MARNFKLALFISMFFGAMYLTASSALADHLPSDLLARGKPETKLAGIDIGKAKLEDVIKLYGPPTRQVSAPNNPSWTGYIWEKAPEKLELGVNRGPHGASIGDIYVEGDVLGQMGSTGRHLKLGDSIEKLKQIYGTLFKIQNGRLFEPGKRKEFTGVTAADQRVTIQWGSDEFTLTAGLDSQGKIIALWLLPPECPRGSCE